jgi:transketolase
MHEVMDPAKYRRIRDEFGETVAALGAEIPEMVVLTADLMYPTRTEKFAQLYPQRFIDVGVAEQNLVGIAAGMATCGKIPLVADYANFLCLRAGEQVRNDVVYTRLNVKLAALSSGLTFGVGGPSHQSYEDLGLMRALPGLIVIVPSDARLSGMAVRAAMRHQGPAYLRLGRDEEKIVYPEAPPFEIGRAILLRRGGDIAIIANGPMVAEALEAADELAESGIRARVLDMHTVKPLDRQAVIACARETQAIITVEEHNIIGGLGSAVLEALAEEPGCPVVRMGIPDVFPVIGPTFELRRHLGLSSANIVGEARRLVRKKKTPLNR